jgi:hypothetical protein
MALRMRRAAGGTALKIQMMVLHAACAQQQRCTYGPCTEACVPCGEDHPGVTFCPADPNGAQCSSRGGTWTERGRGLCENQEHPYGEDLRTKVPYVYKAGWGLDHGPDGKDRGYGWRYCGKASETFTQECEDFCEGLGDCVAIAAGGCCFPYRAACGGLTDRSTSQTYAYYELDREIEWGWSFLLAIGVVSAGYVGGGLAAGRTRGDSGRGLDAHPHARHWRQVGGLIIDGVRVTKGRSRGGAANQPLLQGHEVAASRAAAQTSHSSGGGNGGSGGGGGVAASEGKRSKASKSGKGSKSSKRESKSSRASRSSGSAVAAAATATAADANEAAQRGGEGGGDGGGGGAAEGWWSRGCTMRNCTSRRRRSESSDSTQQYVTLVFETNFHHLI